MDGVCFEPVDKIDAGRFLVAAGPVIHKIFHDFMISQIRDVMTYT